MTEMFPVVILAGGLATRLRPLTETIPKSMIEVNHEPFVAHQLRLLKKNNITHVVMCVGYLANQIQNYVGDGRQFGLRVDFVEDGEKLLGTGGAIKKALPLLSNDFFVLYGDSYLPCDFRSVQALYETAHKLGLMTVFHNRGLWDTSNVEYQAGQILAYDKVNRTDRMQHIDYGLGIFSKSAFEQVPDNEAYNLSDLYQLLLQQNNLAAYEVKQRFYEIGSFAGINELSNVLNSNVAAAENK